jgi:pimeloyl-ACP methyl ester carboxylesterase
MGNVILALSMLLVAIFACGTASAASKPALTPCNVPGGAEIVRCGRLEVPEDWARPDGRRISLNFIVMPKRGPGPEHPPVFWLDGGPGVAGTNSANLYSGELAFHRDRRAVILFDQRGTGGSHPLHCPATEQRSALADMWRPANVTACRHDLEKTANLPDYTTAAAAHDIDAMRAALGYPRIDLMALSYGTILAQAYMKLYPSRVRAAALIGTAPLGEKLPLHHAANGEAALRQVFADCRSDRACDAAYPALAADWSGLMRRLAAGPVTVDTGAGPVSIRFGPFGEAIRSRLNTNWGQRAAPLMISRAARGDFSPFLKSVATQGPEPEADGLYLSVTCPEATRRIRPGEIAAATSGVALGRYRIDQQIAACRLWAPARADPAVLRPLNSDIPVLLLAGGRDATTPVAWARQVAAGLPRSRVIVIPPMAHLPVGLTNMVCLDRIADAFFARGSADGLDISCVMSMAPPPFVVPRSGAAPAVSKDF